MRELAKLLLEFRTTSSKSTATGEDILLPQNFASLKIAIINRCTRESETKDGLMIKLGNDLKTCAKVMQLEYLIQGENGGHMKEKMGSFLLILEMSWPFIFGAAQKSLVKARQHRLRRPEELTEEEDIRLLREFCETLYI